MAAVIDPDQWIADYEAASAQQQYASLMELLSQPLEPDTLEELDLGMEVAVMRDALVDHKLFDETIALLEAVQQHPHFYEEEFPFLDSTLVEYFLFRNQIDRVQTALTSFMAHPEADEESTLAILNNLQLYGQTDLALALALAAYEPVRTSSKTMPGAEQEFSQVWLDHQIEVLWQQQQAGEAIDWEHFLADAVSYGFDKRSKWVTKLQQQVSQAVQLNPPFLALFKRNRAEALDHLSLHFSQFMLSQKQMHFSCSRSLWRKLVDFLDSLQRPSKKQDHPELYFTFELSALNDYVAEHFNPMAGLGQALGLATIWGIPYIYDWLRSQEFISETVHQQTLQTIAELKTTFLKQSDLWKYDFVHRWTPPDSLSAEEFAAEAAQFAATAEGATPLDTEPGRGVTVQMIQDLTKLLPPDLQEMFAHNDPAGIRSLLTRESEPPDNTEPLPPFSRVYRGSDDWQEDDEYEYDRHKPRKSALRLASELPQDPKQPKRKKRK